jgi:hypothetical protein
MAPQRAFDQGNAVRDGAARPSWHPVQCIDAINVCYAQSSGVLGLFTRSEHG